MSISSRYPSNSYIAGYNFARTKRIPTDVQYSRASTGTYVGPDGLINTAQIGEPRFDHDPLTEQCKGLLVENSKTNLVINNSSITLPWWNIPSGAFVDLNSHLAPDGTMTAFKYRPRAFFDRWTANAAAQRFGLGTSGIVYTLSMYFKAAEITSARFDIVGTSVGNGGACTVNLSTGQITGFGSNVLRSGIKPVGNGWYYCFVTAPVTQNVGGQDVQIFRGQSVTDLENDGYYGWGFQLEAGFFPTSYIPTSGSQVTRSADILTVPTPETFTSAQFSFVPNTSNLLTPIATLTASTASPSYSLELSTPNLSPTVRVIKGGVESTRCFVTRPATISSTSNPINVAINFNQSTGEIDLCSSSTDDNQSSIVKLPATAAIKSNSKIDTITINSSTLRSLYFWDENLTSEKLATLADETSALKIGVVNTSGFPDELYEKGNIINNGRPTLDLDFATTKTLNDKITGTNLVTYTRASTGTYVGSDGLIKSAVVNEARFDHNPATGESLGLLVEEARTNLFSGSQDFSNTYWPQVSGVRTNNSSVAPDGTITACLFAGNGTGYGGILRRYYPSWASSTTYTFSCFAKAGTYDRIGFLVTTASLSLGTQTACHFNLSSGVATATTPAAGAVVSISMIAQPNGWYRCVLVYTTSSSQAANDLVDIALVTATGSAAYDGSGNVLLWGAQLEAGSFPTSYIPTVASTVTRSADVASMTGTNFLSWYNANAGCLVVNANTTSTNNYQNYIAIRGASFATNRLSLYMNSTGQRLYYVTPGSVTGVTPAINTQTSGAFKVAVAYNLTSVATTSNGSIATTTATNDVSTTFTTFDLSGSDNPPPVTRIARLTYWPTRLSDAQLQTITAPPQKWELVLDSSIPSDGICALITSGTVTYTVDWGDETPIETVTATGTFTKTHGYAFPKEYVVKITVTSGAFRPFYNASGYASHIKELRETPAGWTNTTTSGFGTSLDRAWTVANKIQKISPLLNTSGITNFSSTWNGCTSLTSFPLIDTSAGTIFPETWRSCTSLTSFPLINTSVGTNFNGAWRSCTSLTSFPLINTAAGTNFSGAWQSCTSLTSFPLINTASGTNFGAAWFGCSSLTSFPLIDTSAGTTFTQAWYGCSSLTSFPLINTAAGTTFIQTWLGCTSLTSFPLINTASGTNFSQTWQSCTSLTSFPLINTAAGTNFSQAWQSCASLTSFPLINTAAGTNFLLSWFGCSNLTSFPLINVSAGTSFGETWRGCTSLTSFPAITFNSATNLGAAWYGCTNLATFPANAFNTTGTLVATAFSNTFLACALNAQSIENILVSLDTNGQSNIALTLSAGTNATKTTWTTAANTAYDALIARGWTITFRA